MKRVNTSMFSNDECWGIQINGLSHCKNIDCRWKGLSPCEGKSIIRTGYNSLGIKIGEDGIILDTEDDTKTA